METTLTKRVITAVLEDITIRVTGTITVSATVRVPVDVPLLNDSLLLLEGDFGGGLAFTDTDEAEGLFGYLTLEGSY